MEQVSLTTEHEFNARDHAQYLAVMTIASLTMVVARVLKPSPDGIGTHEQLGLPACIFHKFTGIPCPSCGLTTSFAYFAHFDFKASFLTQPFGFLLAAATLSSIPLFAILMYRRIKWDRLLASLPSRAVTYWGLGLMLMGWIYKIIITR